MTEMELCGAVSVSFEDAPIGAFDSGYGGLTVLKEIARLMPGENTVFVGDSEFFPYGPKPLKDVRSRVMRICSFLAEKGCKLIVIACNTATAAGLRDAQREFGIPIIGVVEPGSRAAVYVAHTRKIGVIATQGTVNSGAYVDAIQNLDAGIEVIQLATPQLVDYAEAGIQLGVQDPDLLSDLISKTKEAMLPMRREGIDTLVMGCTHFPLVAELIQECIGEDVTLVSSAEETALEVRSILQRQDRLRAIQIHDDVYEFGKRVFYTTSDDIGGFRTFAMRVIGRVLAGYDPVFEHADV